MSPWAELRSVANANVRRFATTASEPWHHDALRIARAFFALFGREDATRLATAALLSSAAALPARDAEDFRRTLMCGHLALPDGGFVARSILAGDLALDAHGRLVIIARTAATPSRSWLAEQRHPPAPADDTWWTAWPLGGGAVLVASSQLFGLGRAGPERCRELVEHATINQVRELITLLPELTPACR